MNGEGEREKKERSKGRRKQEMRRAERRKPSRKGRKAKGRKASMIHRKGNDEEEGVPAGDRVSTPDERFSERLWWTAEWSENQRLEHVARGLPPTFVAYGPSCHRGSRGRRSGADSEHK